MEINIKKISIVCSGCDHIYCHTDLPSACFPFNAEMSFEITAGKGMGVEYVKKHFPNIPMSYVEDTTK